jgi:hypothetical protein
VAKAKGRGRIGQALADVIGVGERGEEAAEDGSSGEGEDAPERG